MQAKSREGIDQLLNGGLRTGPLRTYREIFLYQRGFGGGFRVSSSVKMMQCRNVKKDDRYTRDGKDWASVTLLSNADTDEPERVYRGDDKR